MYYNVYQPVLNIQLLANSFWWGSELSDHLLRAADDSLSFLHIGLE